MAFPTSPSNNQVHKEGQRAFVYDSALGVWDQIRTPARTENNLSHTTGSLSGSVAERIDFPEGHIIQAFTSTVSAARTSNSTSFQPSGLYATITPTSTSSKIVIQYGGPQHANGNDCHMYTTIYRGTTHLGPSNEGLTLWSTGASSTGRWKNCSLIYTDSPNTTSATTYEIWYRVNNSQGWFCYSTSYRVSMTVMEIKA